MTPTVNNKARRGLLASGVAMALALSATAPAYATIDNTVTAGGTPASGTLTPATATENVDVIDQTTGI